MRNSPKFTFRAAKFISKKKIIFFIVFVDRCSLHLTLRRLFRHPPPHTLWFDTRKKRRKTHTIISLSHSRVVRDTTERWKLCLFYMSFGVNRTINDTKLQSQSVVTSVVFEMSIFPSIFHRWPSELTWKCLWLWWWKEKSEEKLSHIRLMNSLNVTYSIAFWDHFKPFHRFLISKVCE